MENNIFSKNLKFLREKNRLTTKELAQGLKVIEETVVSWEIGAKNPEVKDIVKIAKYFSVEASDLTTTLLCKKPTKSKNVNILSIVMSSIILGLSALTLIFFSLKCFSSEAFGYEQYSYFLDLIRFTKFEELTVQDVSIWIVLIAITFNIINSVVLCSSSKLRNNQYAKVGNILGICFNSLSLIAWINILIKNKDVNLEFTAIWLICLFITIILMLTITQLLSSILKKKEVNTNNAVVSSTKVEKVIDYEKRSKQLTITQRVFNIIAIASLVIMLLCFIFSSLGAQAQFTYELYEYGPINEVQEEISIVRSLFDMNVGLSLLIVGSALLLITASILLMIPKINKNKKASIAVSIVALCLVVVLFMFTFGLNTNIEYIISDLIHRNYYRSKINSLKTWGEDSVVLIVIFSIIAIISYLVNLIVTTIKHKTIKK